jgi:glycerophosphoryl diester phosphodiesterase
MHKLLAHRGVSTLAPENTISAFKMALELNLAGIELDVQLSKDGHLVVCHDENVERTTDSKGFIKDLTLHEIIKLDAGSWFDRKFAGEKIPTLEEVLELIGGRNVVLNIELKSGIVLYEGLEKKLLDVLGKYNFLERTIFSSFNHYCLLKLKELNSKVRIGILYYAGLVDPWEYGKKLGAYSLHPFFPSVTETMVQNCLKENLKVIPFTVNDKNMAKKLVDWGVEYIITDVPQEFISPEM